LTNVVFGKTAFPPAVFIWFDVLELRFPKTELGGIDAQPFSYFADGVVEFGVVPAKKVRFYFRV